MKKVLLLFAIILTFGLILIPKSYAYSWSSPNSWNIQTANFNGNYNTITTIDTHNEYVNVARSSTTPISNFRLYGQTTLSFTNGHTYRFTAFVWGSKLSNIDFCFAKTTNGQTLFNLGGFTTGSAIESSPIVINITFVADSTNYVYFKLGNSASVSDFNFNFRVNLFDITSQGDINSNYYIPYGFYYNQYSTISENVGIFQNALVSLKRGVSLTDVTNQVLVYNTLTLDTLSSEIARVNNASGSQQYELVVYLPNMPVNSLMGLRSSFLAITDIEINGEFYNYTDALSNFNWLGDNLNLYSDNQVFINNNALGSNDYIGEILFRISDYAFHSSSYYDSSIGTLGYIKSTSLFYGGVDGNYYYQTGYDTGYNQGSETGYNNGYNTGYSEGINSNRSGFDNLMFAIGNVPITIIDSVLNFEILGFNLKGIFLGIISLLLFIFLFRKFKE